MCGIAGILALDGSPIDSELVSKMTRFQAHRGPDGEGLWTSSSIGLGHRRLSIIDLSQAGRQPMESQDGRFVITYNGEVYNYVELREELKHLGHEFRSRSDTEVILKAYEVWGERCADRFLGMWAFAIWDGVHRKLFCSRDPFGIKPFFYLQKDNRFYFASDIRALLLVSDDAREPDWEFLTRQLSYQRFTRDDETSFRRIRALRPATNLVIENGRVTFTRYWRLSLPDVRAQYDFRHPVTAFRELFTDAVRLNFRSDVPVGVCLSGGLDSSSIVAVASSALGARLKTFSIEYPESAWSEGEFVDEVNARFACDAICTTPRGAQDYLDTLKLMVASHGEPDQGIGVYSQWKVLELASKHVKVVLNGQGGDELLAGYPYFYETYLADLIRRGRWWKAAHEFAAYRDYASSRFGRNTLQRAFPRLAKRWQQLRGWPGLCTFLETLGPRLAERFLACSERVHEFATGELTNGNGGNILATDRLTRHQYQTVNSSLLQSLLYFEDRNSMAFSMESRVPFLDRRLVEFCLALAPEDRLRGGFTKAILRESLADLLPARVRARQDKKGFPTPLSLWLRGPLMSQVKSVLLDDRVRRRKVLNVPVIERRLSEHASGAANHAIDIFSWLTLEFWFQRFQDNALHMSLVSPISLAGQSPAT